MSVPSYLSSYRPSWQAALATTALAQGWNTAAALPYMLTGMSALESSQRRAPSFIDLAQHAGYKTFAFSNSHAVASIVGLFLCASLATYITFQAVQAERKIVHALHLGAFLAQELPGKAPAEAVRKSEFLQNLREGITINPHYRKFTAVAAEQLEMIGHTHAAWPASANNRQASP